MRSLPALGALTLSSVAGCGHAPLSPRDPTPGAVHFTIQSYNVSADHFGDTATVETVGYADADIVCLQETGDEWKPVLEDRYSVQYPNRLFHATGGSGGLTVLSKFPIEDEGIILAPNASQPDWHPAWALRVETPAGPIQILNLHLRAILSGRSSGAEAYLTVDEDHAAEIRTFTSSFDPTTRSLVVGDFNEESGGPAVSYLGSEGYSDILPLYHPGQGTWHGPSLGGQLDKMLDHVLFDGSFASLNAWVVRRGNSDHIPVVAHLEFADTIL
jgi:endonuclease/exonuclease/phosphatase family metal-dependent hydrolase